jgi:leucyl-tRNA synthetase
MIHCPKCGWQAVPDNQLPILLPEKVDITLSGRSPLASVPSFVNTTCPKCGGPASREVDTMDTFMCSAWYVWRFTSPHDTEQAWSKEAAFRWMPLDYYVGGLEHAAQHLIYFRFMSHFLYEIGLTPTMEPVDFFIDNGMVRFGGAKMSKSKGNVVVPTDAVQKYGADALRLAILADTPVQRDIDWTEQGLAGKQRFIAGVWDLYYKLQPCLPKGVVQCPNVLEPRERSLVALLYRTALSVENELERNRGFHVAIAHLHSFVAAATRLLSESDGSDRVVAAFVLQGFLKILGVFAPHVSEILWQNVFEIEESLFLQPWIHVDERFLQEDNVEIVFQINGKFRGSAVLPRNSSREQVLDAALANERFKRYIDGQQIRKTIFVPNRLLNVVIGAAN